jgi:hypothetical protein
MVVGIPIRHAPAAETSGPLAARHPNADVATAHELAGM